MGENESDIQQQGGTPPDMPSGEGGTPPDMPSGEGGTPPDMPSGEGGTPPDMSSGEGGTPPDMSSGEGGTPPDMSSGGNTSSSSITWSGATEITSGGSYDNQTYSSTTFGQNALLISTSENVTLNNPTVTKSGGTTTSDNDSFYGVNTAVLVKGGTTTTINGGTVTTSAAGANGIFSYGGNGGQNGAAGDGTTVVISDTTINTTGDGSGGIMTTGGGVTKASNLTVTTTGRSSAAIRSDRGGGTVSVSGGSYTSSGVGSPAIYSTADITVENATLTSNKSEGVCIEGQNSVVLNNCTLTANNTDTNGNAQFLDAVILYQSMSGDAASGTSTFSMTGGVLNNKSGHLFHVTNTNAVINLNNVTINDSGDGILLSVCDDGWSGASNIATLNATGQTLTGDILVGNDSTLTLNISDSSTFTGNISGNITNNAGTSISTSVGTVNVSLDSSSKWYLDGDTYITSFSGTAANIITGGHTLYVNNSPLSTFESEDVTPASIMTALNIANSVNNTLINGTEYNDSITNSGTNVTIQAQSGDDYIVNNVDSSVTTASLGNLIELGDGDDTVYNYHSYHPTLLGGNGNDSIVVSSGHYTFANGGAGNDSIIGRTPNTVSNGWAMGGYATILGGEGNDYINVGYSNNATIDGGDGNDTIYASGNVATINGGAGSNFVSILPASLDAENKCTYVVLNGNTTVAGFKAGFGNGTDTVYITGESPAVDFKSGGLTLYYDNDSTKSLTFSDIKHTSKLNLYYEASLKAVSEVFIADNEWYSVTANDLSVRDDSELWFVGATAKMNHGVDFSGISSALNISLNTDYEEEVEHFRINNIHSIKGGAGNTTITGSDKSDTIIAGTGRTTIDGAGGNDIISLGSAQALVEFTSGDGSDSIYGFNANSTLSIAGSSYSSARSGSNLILTVGSDKITLFSAASLADAHIIGTLAGGSSNSSTSGGSSNSSTSGGSSNSSTSGGSSNSSTSGGSSNSSTSGGSSNSSTSGGSSNSSTSGGSSNSSTSGGSSTSTTSGGSSNSSTSGGSSTSSTSGGSSTSTTSGGSSNSSTSGGSSNSSTSGGSSSSTTSGGSSTSTTSGGSSTSTTSGGSSTSTTSGGSSSSIASGGSSTTSGRNSTTSSSSITSAASETVTSNETAVVDYIYAGGDEVISNYTSGQKIALGTYPTGGNFVDGNFVLSSASGNLIVQNAADKVIDMVDSEGNAFIKAYAATNPGLIDGRGIAGYEIIAGSDAGADLIFAGDGGSQLWGGAGIASDTLIGGDGTDIFVGGKYQGADVFGNASAYDVVYLNDTTLSDIVATSEQNGVIAVAFNTGNVIAAYSSQTLSSAFVLADGSAWRYNHATKSWQSA